MEKLKILVIDDDERVREEISEFLKEKKYKVFSAGLPSEALRLLQEQYMDIIILDIKLPEMDGLKVLKKVKEMSPDTEVIMISGHGDMQSVIEAMRNGAIDFFPKPFRLIDVDFAIHRTKRFVNQNIKIKELETNYSSVSKELKKQLGNDLIGQSQAMNTVVGMMAKIANVENTTVIITGESGTGKELVARGIHYLSSRKDNFFYPVNCSAIPDTLFESEFFGHKKGTFTGAIENKAGWFEIANSGTLFLDEIGDMPLLQQAKLLRVLEDRTVSRLGSHDKIKVDVRVIAASNQNLEQMCEEKKFRLDLYHRISSFTIHIPPLRERKEDIPLLVDYYIKYFTDKLKKPVFSVSQDIFSALSAYSFPGNIRELRNLVERAMIVSENGLLNLKDFNLKITGEPEIKNETKMEFQKYDLEETEKSMIISALEKTSYNKSKAAELLNISWQSLDRRMKKFNIESTG